MKSFISSFYAFLRTQTQRKLPWSFGERTVHVTSFASHKFRCSCQTEFFRTAEFGGELAPLGAFLFLLESSDIVWDIGASVGLVAIHAADIASSVVAFEPDKITHARLVQNVTLNGLAHKVQCLELALGDVTGTTSLSSDGLDGNAPSIVDLGRHQRSSSVEMTTVDNLVKAGLPRPTVLKIDIEGAEVLALKGAHELLASHYAPRLIFLEVHPNFIRKFGDDPKDPEEILRKSGYAIVAMRKRADQYHMLAFKAS